MSAVNELESDYDSVVVHLTHTMTQATLQEVQYSLMMHETRIKNQNPITQVSLTNAYNVSGYNRDLNQNRREHTKI